MMAVTRPLSPPTSTAPYAVTGLDSPRIDRVGVSRLAVQRIWPSSAFRACSIPFVVCTSTILSSTAGRDSTSPPTRAVHFTLPSSAFRAYSSAFSLATYTVPSAAVTPPANIGEVLLEKKPDFSATLVFHSTLPFSASSAATSPLRDAA